MYSVRLIIAVLDDSKCRKPHGIDNDETSVFDRAQYNIVLVRSAAVLVLVIEFVASGIVQQSCQPQVISVD